MIKGSCPRVVVGCRPTGEIIVSFAVTTDPAIGFGTEPGGATVTPSGLIIEPSDCTIEPASTFAIKVGSVSFPRVVVGCI